MEYGLILALIAAMCFVAVREFGVIKGSMRSNILSGVC